MLVILFAVSALVLAAISLEFGSKLILQNNESQANFIANHVRETIDDRFQHKITLFQTLTDTPFLQQFVKDSNERFANMQEPDKYITSVNDDWITADKDEITPYMQSLIDNPLSKQLQKTQSTITNHNGEKIIAEIILTNAYGVNVAQTGKTTDYIQNDEEWWIQAKENGVFIDNVNIDESAGVYSIDIAIAMEDYDGNFIGVRKVVWKYSDVLQQLNRIESEFGGKVDIVLTTQEGKTIYQSAPDWFEQIKEKIPFQPVSAVKQVQATPKPLVESYSYSQSQGFGNHDGLGWFVIVNLDNAKIVEPLFNFQLMEVGLIFVIIGFASFATLSFSKSLNKKINTLSKTTEKIADGDYDTKVDVKEKDEFYDLVHSINMMGAKLQSNQKKTLEEERLSTIGEISAKIAHDMRNPLSVLKNTAKIMKIKKISGTEKYTPIMEDCIERLSHQVEDIMDYLRDRPLQLEQINLQPFLEDIVKETKCNRNIWCQIDCPDLQMNGDKYKLRSAILNIMHNAKQAIGKENGWIKVDCKIMQDQIMLQISNSGPVIPEQYMQKIFEPLFTTKQRGTGLGLRSVLKIVDEHHGNISVRNNPVTFTIQIPTIMVNSNNEHLGSSTFSLRGELCKN